jgi:putative ABC transport system permease protein
VLDRNLPLHKLATIETALGEALARRRFLTALLSIFAALAMLLAAIGIYGLLSFWVRRSESEIAVRIAVGARPAVILRWIGGKGVRLALLGIAIGGIGAWTGAEVLGSMVFGVQPREWTNIAAAALVTLAVSSAAVLTPAWRASRVDPARKLSST